MFHRSSHCSFSSKKPISGVAVMLPVGLSKTRVKSPISPEVPEQSDMKKQRIEVPSREPARRATEETNKQVPASSTAKNLSSDTKPIEAVLIARDQTGQGEAQQPTSFFTDQHKMPFSPADHGFPYKGQKTGNVSPSAAVMAMLDTSPGVSFSSETAVLELDVSPYLSPPNKQMPGVKDQGKQPQKQKEILKDINSFQMLGSVMNIIIVDKGESMSVVVVEPKITAVLNEGSTLFLFSGEPLGEIEEVFGHVRSPLYKLIFASPEAIHMKGVYKGQDVYFFPNNPVFTQYIAIEDLLKATLS